MNETINHLSLSFMSEIQENIKYSLKHPALEIPANEPFKNDTMKRKELCDALCNLVSKIEGPLVVSINAPWGTGKTTFLEMWNKSLTAQNFTTVKFNAWTDDYFDNPLIALTGQISASIKESGWKEVGKTMKEIPKLLLQKTILQLMTNLTGCNIEQKDLMSVIDQTVDDYGETRKLFEDFKARLENKSQEALKETGKPLIIIIDELDRCRPIFAISMLERIKHFFEIPGLVFVLALDREQLGHSIRSVYGQEMDVVGYLRRFIDLEFKLLTSDLQSFLKKQFYKFGIWTSEKQTNSDWFKNHFSPYIKNIIDIFSLTSRDIETMCRVLAVSVCMGEEINDSSLQILLIALKLHDDPMYDKLLKQECTAVEIIDHLFKEYQADRLFSNYDEIAYDLIPRLYSVSPDNWQKEVWDWGIRKSPLDSPNIDQNAKTRNDFPSEYFHQYIINLFFKDNKFNPSDYNYITNKIFSACIHHPTCNGSIHLLTIKEYIE
jgi:hypothetical protein